MFFPATQLDDVRLIELEFDHRRKHVCKFAYQPLNERLHCDLGIKEYLRNFEKPRNA